MSVYRETNDQNGRLVGIVRISDGANIPLSEGNRDYQEYRAWVDAGNKADPDPRFTTEFVKSRKWEEIKLQRDSRKAGGVQLGDYWFHTDDTSRIQWLGIKDTARDMKVAGAADTAKIQILGQDLLWKTMSGAFIPVTVKTAFDVNQAVKDLDASLFALAEQKRVALNSDSTPVDFNTAAGWPLTYTEATTHVAA